MSSGQVVPGPLLGIDAAVASSRGSGGGTVDDDVEDAVLEDAVPDPAVPEVVGLPVPD